MKGIKKILLGLLLLSTTLVFSQGFTLGNRMLMGGVVTPASSEITLTSTSVLASWSPNLIVNTGTTLDWTVSGGVTIATTTIDEPDFNFSSNTGTANVLIENTNDLTEFNVTNLGIVTVDISEALSLTRAIFTNNLLTTFDSSSNTNLVEINISTNSISTYDPSNNIALTNFGCQDNSILILDLSSNTNLLTVNLRGNGMTSVNVTGLTSMTQLSISGNSLASFDISTLTVLSDLECHTNNFSIAITNQLLADLVANGINNGTLFYRNNETGQGVTDRATLITRGWTIFNSGT